MVDLPQSDLEMVDLELTVNSRTKRFSPPPPPSAVCEVDLELVYQVGLLSTKNVDQEFTPQLLFCWVQAWA